MPFRRGVGRVRRVCSCCCAINLKFRECNFRRSSPDRERVRLKSSAENILDVMRAPSPPYPLVSPTHDAILLLSMQEYPSISRVATPFLRLAGVRVEPRNHSKHDTPGGYGITPYAVSYDLVHIADRMQTRVALPEGACPGIPMWAADGKRFAFVNLAQDSVELWIGDGRAGEVQCGSCGRITSRAVWIQLNSPTEPKPSLSRLRISSRPVRSFRSTAVSSLSNGLAARMR